MAPNAALTAQSPPARIPRLRYRNALPSDNVVKSSQGSGPHSPYTQEPPAALVPDSNHPLSAAHSPSATARVTSSSLASLHSNNSSGNDSKSSSKKKKKTSSVLGFLSLKEPSQAAFEQIAQQQRKQNRGSSTPPSNSNYAGQKLPQNVPKVNSKWDGVPVSVKQRHSTISHTSSKDNRNSVSSSKRSVPSPLNLTSWSESKLSVMTDGTRNPPNSIASLSVSNLSVQDAVPSPGFASSPTAFPKSAPDYPDGPLTPSTPSYNAHMTDQSNFRPAKVSLDSPSDSRPSLDGSIHSRPHSPASSTTSADTITMDTADTIFRKLNDRSSPGALSKEIHVTELQDHYKPDMVPESHDFLFQPQPTVEIRNTNPPATYNHVPDEFIPPYSPARPVQNFSRPTGFTGPPPVQRNTFMPPYRRTPSGPSLPTLYESSIAGTEEPDDDNNEDDDTHSIAPSTIAPSELSLQWYESPRERLGLGRRLQINDVLPWDEQRGATGKPKKSRLLVFGRSSKG